MVYVKVGTVEPVKKSRFESRHVNTNGLAQLIIHLLMSITFCRHWPNNRLNLALKHLMVVRNTSNMGGMLANFLRFIAIAVR